MASVAPLLFFLTLFSKFQPGVGRDACWMTMQSATYRDGLSQGLEPTQELQVQTEPLCRTGHWRQSSLELGTEEPRGEKCKGLVLFILPSLALPEVLGTQQVLGRSLAALMVMNSSGKFQLRLLRKGVHLSEA